MQYRVPQNIDMADKIVGPLTMIQFLYVAIGGSIVYLTLTKGGTFIFVVVGIPTGLLTLAMAFYKPQDQPFSHFILSLISYLFKPKDRVWIKGSAEEAVILPHKEKMAPKPLPKKKITKSELQKITEVLDSGGWKSLENVESFHTTKNEMATEQKRVEEEVSRGSGIQPATVNNATSQPLVQPANQTNTTTKQG